MALNFPGPYELRFSYTILSVDHTLRTSVTLNQVPVAGTSFAQIEALTPSGSTPFLSAWVEDFLTELGKQFNTGATTFGVVELWSYAPLSLDATFVSSYSPIAQPTSNSAYNLAQQTTYTWRTVEGGILKIVLLESVNDFTTLNTYPTPFTNPTAFMTLVSDPTASPIIARDTSRPFSPLKMSNGQNESVFRKRYR